MSIDDIPQALRKPTKNKPLITSYSLWLGGGAVIAGILVLSSAALLRDRFFPSNPTSSVASEVSPSPNVSPDPTTEVVDNILGHLPYTEAPSQELAPITSDGQIRLRKVAAQEFKRMQQDARQSGVFIAPISGFRTVSEQNHLFFEVKEQRNQDAQKRAEVSAPPGYSEHHTGYAIDIGDGRSPATNLSQSFENTPAFAWLKKNAARYSFELSFPPNNPQGINYEPWHWRYVGDKTSLETFYRAQKLKK